MRYFVSRLPKGFVGAATTNSGVMMLSKQRGHGEYQIDKVGDDGKLISSARRRLNPVNPRFFVNREPKGFIGSATTISGANQLIKESGRGEYQIDKVDNRGRVTHLSTVFLGRNNPSVNNPSGTAAPSVLYHITDELAALKRMNAIHNPNETSGNEPSDVDTSVDTSLGVETTARLAKKAKKHRLIEKREMLFDFLIAAGIGVAIWYLFFKKPVTTTPTTS